MILMGFSPWAADRAKALRMRAVGGTAQAGSRRSLIKGVQLRNSGSVGARDFGSVIDHENLYWTAMGFDSEA